MDQGVGRRVKELREERNWSQAKLAVEADMSVSGVSMIENGQRNLTTTTLGKLAGAFGVEVADLFPKAEAPLPFEDANEEALEERRIQTFLDAFPSEEDRVGILEKTAEIFHGYTDRWRMEVEEVEARGTFPYGKSIEMRTLWERLSETIQKDGTHDFVGWVEVGRLRATEKEREASIKVVDALIDMFNVVGRMHEVEYENRKRAGKEAEELERLEAEFADTTAIRKRRDERGLD